MKKPGFSLAAILLAVSTHVSAATVSFAAMPQFVDHNDSLIPSRARSFNIDVIYSNSITPVPWGNTAVSVLQDAFDIPVPAAAWLFLSGLVGMIGVSRRKRKQ